MTPELEQYLRAEAAKRPKIVETEGPCWLCDGAGWFRRAAGYEGKCSACLGTGRTRTRIIQL